MKENWRIFKRAAGVHGTTVVAMNQVHGDRVLVADKSSGKNAGEGDAIVTATPGVLLGILTADCVPVLIVDPERRIAAAVHAGWKGTLSGILPKTIGLTRERFGTRPLDLYFAVGPSIGPLLLRGFLRDLRPVRDAVGTGMRPRLAAGCEGERVPRPAGDQYPNARTGRRAARPNRAGGTVHGVFDAGLLLASGRSRKDGTTAFVRRVAGEFGVRSSEFGVRSSEFGVRSSELLRSLKLKVEG